MMYGKVIAVDFFGIYDEVLIDNEKDYIDHIKKRDNACEMIGRDNQLIKPIFDFDSYDKIDIPLMTKKINKMFPNKIVHYAVREPRLKNNKMRYSARAYVDGVMITSSNIGELVKDSNFTEADASIYNKKRKMFLPLTTRKKELEKVPILMPINGATYFQCCASYIEEGFENWDERVQELVRGKKLLEAIEKHCSEKEKKIINSNDNIDTTYTEDKLYLYISKLKAERATSYDSWSKMIWCLCNICNTEGISNRKCSNIIHEFSKKAINYDENATDDFISKCDNLREASYKWKYMNECIKEDDAEFYKSITTLTYIDLKKVFEKTHCKILCPPMVLYYNKDSEYYQSSIKSSKESYAHLQCKVFVKKLWVTKQFIELWFKDPEIRHYEKVVFEPPPNTCNPCYFNTWVDFKISNEPFITTGRNYWEEYLTFANNLFGDEKVVKYLLARYAYKIQYPAKRTYVIAVITGNEGDGKNRFLAPIYNIMDGYTVELPKAKDLFEKHSNHEERKLMIIVNEASGSANFENSEVLKTRITEDRLTVNPKGIQAYSIVNRADYDLTGNGEKLVKASDDSTRRFFQTESTSFYSGNIDFFSDYIENIEKNPIALRQIYEGLKNYDWKSIVPSGNFQDAKYKPMTAVLLRVISSNRDKIVCFIEDWVRKQMFHNPKENYKVKGKSLYMGFCNWCRINNVKCEYSSISFGCRFSMVVKKQFNSNGLECIKRDLKNTTTTLNLPELNKYFEKINGCPFENDDDDDDLDYFDM